MKSLFGPLVLFILLMTVYLPIKAQVSVKDSVLSGALVHIDYGIYQPFADLADRYGYFGRVDIGFLLKNKQNWLYGPQGGMIFGSRIKDTDVLAPFRTDDGPILGSDGFLGDVTQFQRGFHLGIQFGKLFNKIGGLNPNSGMIGLFGVGFIQHKIRLEDLADTFTLLDDNLRNGLDRLTNGIYLNQFIGYNYMDNKRFLNFTIGIDLMQGFTANRRNWNVDTMEREDGNRLDLTIGLKIAWVLPIYEKPEERYFKY